MDPALIALQKVFEYLGIVGATLKRLFGMKVEIGVTPELERLIERYIATQEPPVQYWDRIVETLGRQDESKFRSMAGLEMTNEAIGAEALFQSPDKVPHEMVEITSFYIREYVTKPADGSRGVPQLPHSALAEALAPYLTAPDANPITVALDQRGRVPVRLTKPNLGE